MSTPTFTYLDTELAFSQIGDAQVMDSMLVMLQESLQRDIALIADLLASDELAGANRVLHALKGFVPIFCCEGFCTQVVDVEALSKVGPSSNVAQAYATLRPELQRLLDDVNTYLAQSQSAA
ncbi:Hpt domain-containing protein [Rhodoferax sp. GW822-FHT02A01]|uniref:Hpt domain-containing protein n=1 Tax=Rhodoferax sp. GW822-FHT02A01 TaxID=3141537 RepID=UPI00315D6172